MTTYTEPTWTTPIEYRTESIFARRPVLSSDMTAILIRLLQFHFSKPEFIDRDQLKAVLWNVDRTKSKILIGPESLKNAKDVGNMPSLMVGRLSTKIEQIGLENTTITSLPSTPSTTAPIYPEYITKAEFTTRFNTNIHGVFCRGLSGTETEALIDEVLIFLTAYAMVIRRDLNLHNFNVSGIDTAKKVEGKETDWFMAPIQVLWSMDLTYQLTEDMPL